MLWDVKHKSECLYVVINTDYELRELYGENEINLTIASIQRYKKRINMSWLENRSWENHKKVEIWDTYLG